MPTESTWMDWIKQAYNDFITVPPVESDIYAAPPPIAKNKRMRSIPDVHEEVRKGNLYYPLQGPPQTPEEKEILRQYIEAEQHAISDAMFDRLHRYPVDLKRMAERNCADLRLDYNYCLKRKIGTFYDFMDLCNYYQLKWRSCIKRNEEILTELGFAKTTDRFEMERMLDKADEIYLKEQREKEAAKSKSA